MPTQTIHLKGAAHDEIDPNPNPNPKSNPDPSTRGVCVDHESTLMVCFSAWETFNIGGPRPFPSLVPILLVAKT